MTRVVKVGGRPQQDPALARALGAAHTACPGSLVVVHGGGDEVSSLQALYGAETRFHDGRRVTSVIDLAIVRMALSGSANKRLVSALVDAGVPAVGVSGEDAGQLVAEPLDVDRYGYVGKPARVEDGLLRHLLAGGFLPVFSPVSRSTAGGVLNVNGDDAAAAVAVALRADELLFVSDVPGVLVNGATTAALTEDEARALLDEGIAGGGMAAKLDAALSALDGGVERVRISDLAAIGDDGRGTVLTRAGSICK